MLKRIIFAVAFITIINSFVISVKGESIYEYYFYPDNTENSSNDISSEYTDFIEALPDEIKERLPDTVRDGDINELVANSEEVTDFSYIWKELIKGVINSFFPSLKATLVIIGILIFSSLIKLLEKNISSNETGKLADTVINIAVIISIVGSGMLIIDEVDRFKDLICNLMNGMIPVFGVVYAVSGNGSTAAIQSGGVMLLVTLCQNLFAMILLPSVRICLLMSIANAIFPDSGIKPVTSIFKNISISIMAISVTLFSFILNLQNTVAESADTFGIKSIKFAVGNLVPIIGGAVSDSLGTIGGSLSLLKSAGGTVVIIIIILLLLPTLSMLTVRRLSFFICKTAAGILGCTSEEKLLDDIGGVVSMMLAFCVAISISFIYILTLFTGSALAISG